MKGGTTCSLYKDGQWNLDIIVFLAESYVVTTFCDYIMIILFIINKKIENLPS